LPIGQKLKPWGGRVLHLRLDSGRGWEASVVSQFGFDGIPIDSDRDGIPIEGGDFVRTFRLALIQALSLLLIASPALAEDSQSSAGITSDPSSLSDAELDKRIDWLQTTLDDGAFYSKLWQHGWTGGYATGIVIGTVQAATTSKNDTRVSAIVTASKAVIGTGRLLLDSHPGRLGAQPMLDISGDGRDAKLSRLAAGEAQLLKVGERAEKRLRWQRHAGSLALNLAGGAFVWGFADLEDAAVSVGVGILVGELMIFTSPKRGAADLTSYQQRFAGVSRDKWTVSLVPTFNGAKIRVDF
jgi:hypothetical protein